MSRPPAAFSVNAMCMLQWPHPDPLPLAKQLPRLLRYPRLKSCSTVPLTNHGCSPEPCSPELELLSLEALNPEPLSPEPRPASPPLSPSPAEGRQCLQARGGAAALRAAGRRPEAPCKHGAQGQLARVKCGAARNQGPQASQQGEGFEQHATMGLGRAHKDEGLEQHATTGSQAS